MKMETMFSRLRQSFSGRAFRKFGAACLSLSILAGCSNIMEEDDFRIPGNGRTHARLALDLAAPSANIVTRGIDMSEDAQVKIESMWIGIFDTKTGEQVGRMAGHVRKDDGTRITFGRGTYTLDNIDIYYYDSNPEVYIVGVANYHNNGHVLAHMAGEKDEVVPLYELLGIDGATVGNRESTFSKEITWEDFCNISVDTQSADRALDKEGSCPIMMGFFDAGRGVITSAVDGDGVVNGGGTRLVGAENTSSMIDLSGCLNLKRLISEFQVSVRAKESDEDDRSRIKVSNVRYKIVNMPLEVYLAEHSTFAKSATAGKGTYLKNTPNSADVAVINKIGAGYTESDWMEAAGSPEEGYTFSFQQYENKHWGAEYDYGHKMFKTPDWEYGTYMNDTFFQMSMGPYPETLELTWRDYLSYWANGPIQSNLSNPSFNGPRNPWLYMSLVAERNAHSIREAKWNEGDGKDILKSLVADTDKNFNNYASYIVIQADVEEVDYSGAASSHAAVQYTIHEGYTSNLDGTSIGRDYEKASNLNDVTNRILDFQCVRNTRYIYDIQINGAEDLYMQATSSGSYAHNDGLTGNYTNPVYIQKVWSGGGNGSAGSYDMDDFPALYHKATSNATPAVRFYEKKPVVKDGEIIGYETFNYGNTTSDYAEWPPIEGKMLGLDQLPDDLKDFVLVYILDGDRTTGLGGSQGYKDRHDATPPYFKDELGFEMKLVDFLEQWDPADNPYENTDYYIYVNGYTAPSDVAYNAYDEYHRGVYFVMDVVDDDGCTVNMMQGFEQDGLYDTRANCPSVTEIFNHNIRYDSSWGRYSYFDQFIGNWTYRFYWSTGLGVVSDDRIEWVRVKATYYTDPDDRFSEKVETVTKYKLQMYEYDDNADDFNIKEDIYYIVDIEQHPEYVKTYPWYRGGDDDYPVISVPTKELVEKWNLKAGVYGLAVMPLADERYVQPCKPSRDDIYRLIVHAPKWTFDDKLLYEGELHSGSGRSGEPNDTYTFGGLTLVGGSGADGYDPMEIDTEKGHVDLGSTGVFKSMFGNSTDANVIKFRLAGPAEVKVTAYNPYIAAARPLCFAARNNGKEYYNAWVHEVREVLPAGRTKTITFDTCEVVDDWGYYPFDDGTMEFAIYCGDGHLFIEDIEIIPYTGERHSLSTVTFSHSQQVLYDADAGNFSFLHNDNMYMEDVPGGKNYLHYAYPGITTYLGLNVSQDHKYATAFELGLYADIYDDKPVYSVTVPIDDCKIGACHENSIIIPFMVPSYVNISLRDYIPKITAIGDGRTYISGRPRQVKNMGSPITYEPFIRFGETPSWMPDSGRNNPFYDNSFKNKPGFFKEHKGLVLHGGENSITLSANSVNFGGNGYPINSLAGGRYLSFTTDRPVDVVINATGGNDATNSVERAFRLYNVSKSLDKDAYIDRQVFPNGGGATTKTLSTGIVDGPTEFIICPEQGITLNSITLRPAEDPRESLVAPGSIAYSNWSSEPDVRSHPYFYGMWTNPFYAMRYFTSYVSFSDALGLADSYLFEVYDEQGKSVYSTTVDSRLMTYDGTQKVFTVPMWTGDLEGVHGTVIGPDQANYSIKVTPKGDEERFKPAAPQDIVKMAVFDWTDTSNYPPREEYPDMPDYAWTTMTGWSFDILSKESGNEIKTVTPIGKDRFMESDGLRINGSGNNGTTLIVAGDTNGESGKDYFTWINFGGVGYPYIGRTNDSNVSTGRNISITTDRVGKFLIMARSGNTDTNKRLLLYNAGKSLEKEGYIDEAKLLYDNSYGAADLMETGGFISLETGDISQPTEFLICPDGSLQILTIAFIPKDNPLYDWDWSQGFPGNGAAANTRAAVPSSWIQALKAIRFGIVPPFPYK